jgi:exosortase H (IPTLxxWG-CTERM-specific)
MKRGNSASRTARKAAKIKVAYRVESRGIFVGRLKRHIEAHIHRFGFVLVFACYSLFAFGMLVTPPAQSLDKMLSRTLVGFSQNFILFCGGHVFRDAAVLRSPEGFSMEMRDGCNAINVTILLCSAILAFPAPSKAKVLGLLGGCLIIQALNIVRFVSLFYLGQFSMSWFEFAHSYLWESMLVLDTMVVFWLWVNRVVRAKIYGI